MLAQLQLRSGEVITRHHHHQHHHHHPRGSIRDAHADESVQIRCMSIEHEHVAIVEEGEARVVGREKMRRMVAVVSTSCMLT